ncbi:MAG: biotin carboxylase N-terminal domain-containing protein, partial [Gaiellales bacterium]
MITALLIANRGEIAVRIARTARRLGIETIAIATEDDDGALHTRSADRTVPVGSYLDPTAITDAAARSGARAVHPGYGFLAEDAGFARAVEAAGLLWVGPPPPPLGLAGDKLEARSRAARAGIPTLTSGDPDDVGYPLVVKAAGGPPPPPLRVVRS